MGRRAPQMSFKFLELCDGGALLRADCRAPPLAEQSADLERVDERVGLGALARIGATAKQRGEEMALKRPEADVLVGFEQGRRKGGDGWQWGCGSRHGSRSVHDTPPNNGSSAEFVSLSDWYATLYQLQTVPLVQRNPALARNIALGLVLICTFVGAAAQILMKTGTQGTAPDGALQLFLYIFRSPACSPATRCTD